MTSLRFAVTVVPISMNWTSFLNPSQIKTSYPILYYLRSKHNAKKTDSRTRRCGGPSIGLPCPGTGCGRVRQVHHHGPPHQTSGLRMRLSPQCNPGADVQCLSLIHISEP